MKTQNFEKGDRDKALLLMVHRSICFHSRNSLHRSICFHSRFRQWAIFGIASPHCLKSRVVLTLLTPDSWRPSPSFCGSVRAGIRLVLSRTPGARADGHGWGVVDDESNSSHTLAHASGSTHTFGEFFFPVIRASARVSVRETARTTGCHVRVVRPISNS